MAKTFKRFGDECPRCGNEAEVLTSAQGNFAYDGDLAQCVECGLEGTIDASDQDDNGDYIARVIWDDFEHDDN